MKYQELRDALAEIQHSLPWSYAGCNTVEDSQGDEVAHPCDLSLAEPVAVIANGLSALLAERDALEQQNKGYEAQHTRDSQELRRLCQARDDARKERDRFSRMFGAACEALGLINEALGLDPDDGGAEPILQAIAEIKAGRDALREALKQADALVAAHTRPGDDIADAVRAAARAALSQGEQT